MSKMFDLNRAERNLQNNPQSDGARLYQIMSVCGVSPSVVSSVSKITRKTILKWIYGESNPSRKKQKDICIAITRSLALAYKYELIRPPAMTYKNESVYWLSGKQGVETVMSVFEKLSKIISEEEE